eukprot:3588511-Amphidinium_carterae.1
MSRDVFEASGLKERLKFPKRPALYSPGPCKSSIEERFIRDAIRNNANIRALFENLDDDLVAKIVEAAVPHTYPA